MPERRGRCLCDERGLLGLHEEHCEGFGSRSDELCEQAEREAVAAGEWPGVMEEDGGRIDISDQVETLLAQLGFPDKTVVAEVRIGLRDVTVLYYPLAEDGYKHIADDGYPVTRWRRLRVTT